ncbi:MAG TPA: VIT domain-containing protein [Polyangiaceae bacterium]|jgi:Ca-activated chloride channel family protein|nr:VIT domain-containing protein [Polyangiaceae bacterium]
MAPITAQTCIPLNDEELAQFAAGDQPGLGALTCAAGRLPLRALSVDARVVGLGASLEVLQTFENTLHEAIEATYVFPLPDRAAVTRFQMRVAGRLIEGEIQERAQARHNYETAIASGQRAALAEEDRAGVFTLQLGNLGPGEVAEVRLTLVLPIPVDQGEATFQFPLLVAPRYVPGHELPSDSAGLGAAGLGVRHDTDLVPDASRISPPVLLPGSPNPVRLSLRVNIDGAGLALEPPRSSLHAVVLEQRAGYYDVRLEPGERLNRDFILRWRVSGPELQATAVFTPDNNTERGTLSVMLLPEDLREAPPARDVVFLLDRSGSMGNWKMVAARRAVARMVDTLGANDRFGVLAFDHRIVEPPGASGLQPATDRTRFRAVEFLAGLEADGGTEMAEPLLLAAKLLASGDPARERALVLVTDGQVGNEDDILTRLVPLLGNVRVFTLGIDKAVNAAFLRRLAAAGGGSCELVESEDRLDLVMDKIHRRIGTPLVTAVQVDVEGMDVDRTSMAPARVGSLFAGSPLRLALRTPTQRAEGEVVIRGRTPAGRAFERRIPIASAPSSDAPAALWARARVRDLEDDYLTCGVRGKQEIEHRIVSTSLTHRVLSRFTAFVAIDHEVANPGGNPRQIMQAVEVPDGWGDVRSANFAAPRTASPMRAPVLASPLAAPAAAAPPPSPANPTGLLARSRNLMAIPIAPDPEPEVDCQPYYARVEKLARELSEKVNTQDVRGFELLLGRLGELLEDLRAIGAPGQFIERLARILNELQTVLDSDLDRAKDAIEQLANISRSSTGTPAEPRPGGRTFWK